MAKVEVMENGTVLDTINADLVEKSGKRMYLIKRYKGRQDILKVFHADKAVYTYVKGKGAYKIYVDHETLEQLSPKEAFIDKRLPPRLQTLNEEASDVMAAHKEAAKRIKGELGRTRTACWLDCHDHHSHPAFYNLLYVVVDAAHDCHSL